MPEPAEQIAFLSSSEWMQREAMSAQEGFWELAELYGAMPYLD